MTSAFQDIDSMEVAVQVSWYLREEDGAWVAGCPALGVVTQVESKQAARWALEEAVEMWMESCLERETLDTALRELGWYRPDCTTRAGPQAAKIPSDTGADALGERFRLTLRFPAYRFDHLLGAGERAAGS